MAEFQWSQPEGHGVGWGCILEHPQLTGVALARRTWGHRAHGDMELTASRAVPVLRPTPQVFLGFSKHKMTFASIQGG